MAFTLTSRRDHVFGDERVLLIKGTVNIIGDTYDTGLHGLDFVSVESGSTNAIGHTASGGVITFAGTTGAVNVMAIGH